MTTFANTRLAVLVDADNAQPSAIAEVLGEVARYGTATIKRAYGDWTTDWLNGWKKLLHVHAIQPMQQFRYTKGKNATDSALIIDAMDILHEGKVDGFCLVSSDSDFTRLATRIREAGLVVYGFGERAKTPEPFVAACDKFIFTEILRETVEDTGQEAGVAPALKEDADTELQELLLSAIASTTLDDGWAGLAAVGGWLNKRDPSFDPRSFGYRKLGDLVRAQPYLEVDERQPEGATTTVNLYVRRKELPS